MDTLEEKNENTETPEDDDDKFDKKALADFLDVAESTFIIMFVLVMICTYLLHPVDIVGHSMVPTLNYTDSKPDNEDEDTDKILMSTVYTSIKYGDILVIDNNANYLVDDNGEAYVPDDVSNLDECIIKRVIAVGGQTIDIRDSQVIVDGKVLDEPYINPGSTTEDLGAFTNQYPFKVPEGYYFVMGDNRNHSSDSRDPHIGLIKADQVYGKALVVYSPISEFDILTDSWKG